jgi:flagellar FliL protein
VHRNRLGKLPIIIIAVVLVVLLLAGAGVFVMKSRGAKHGGEAKKKGPTSTMALGEFVVNLADTGEVRYLKTNVVLELVGEAPGSGGGHGGGGGEGANAPVRDAIIQVMSSKRFSELVSPAGKDKLKADIIAAVNKRLEHAEVTNVYFSEFAMQ